MGHGDGFQMVAYVASGIDRRCVGAQGAPFFRQPFLHLADERMDVGPFVRREVVPFTQEAAPRHERLAVSNRVFLDGRFQKRPGKEALHRVAVQLVDQAKNVAGEFDRVFEPGVRVHGPPGQAPVLHIAHVQEKEKFDAEISDHHVVANPWNHHECVYVYNLYTVEHDKAHKGRRLNVYHGCTPLPILIHAI